MANFIRAANPIWYMVDLNGLGLNDQYYAFFLQNVAPYLPQPVFQDPNGSNPWSDPLQFNPNGTLPNNLYFNDEQTYRIEVRQGPNQTDPLIYLVENFQPAGEQVMPSAPTLISLNNIITNSQFSEVSFTGTVTFTSPGTFDVAPGWQLVLTGGGTATVQQIVTLANEDETNNPPYALRITTNGTTTAELIQTFNGTGVLFASVTGDQDGYATGSVTARGISGNYQLTLNYETDNETEVQLAQDTAILNSFTVIDGINKIPVVDPGDTFPNNQTAVYFIIVLLNSGTVEISNVQMTGELVPVGTAQPTIPLYQQEPLERQIDHFYHLERQELLLKPIPSYLIGWDFRLNPAQFNGDTVAVQNIGAQKSFYNWDQTIIYQSVNTLVSTARGTSDEMVLTMANPGQIAVIQYLSGNILAEILNNRLSVNISAYAEGQNIPITVSLWYNTGQSLPLVSAGNNNSIVLTLDSNGKPATFNPCTSPGPILVNWVEVPRDINNAANATATILTGSNFSDYGLNSWNLDDFSGANSATYFAIVIGTESLNAATKLHISSISLVPGDNPTRPAPQTFDEVLRQCQFYYEKSYPVGVIPGTSFTGNCAQFPVLQATITGPIGNPIYNAVLDTIQFDYKTKRTTPNFAVYVPQPNPNVPTAGFSVFWWEAEGGPHPIGFIYTSQQFGYAWTTNNISTDRYGARPVARPTWQPNVGSVTTGILDAYVEFQWTLDARLGVV